MATLLIINDDPVQLHLIANLLEPDYDQVTTFSCSEAAWRWLQEGHLPDGIILDLHMPGINGWQFCELLQSHFSWRERVPPVLVVSASYSGVNVQELLQDFGATAFLPLPADPLVLKQQIQQMLELPSDPATLQVWVIAGNECDRQRIQVVLADRGWRVRSWESGNDVMAADYSDPPDIVIVDDLLPDGSSRDVVRWCKHTFPQVMCVQLGGQGSETPNGPDDEDIDAFLRKGCDPLSLIALCEKGRWGRALSQVEHLLEIRTSDLKESEAQFRGLFELLPDVLVIYDDQGLIQHINVAGAALLGQPPIGIIGQPLDRLCPSLKTVQSEKTLPSFSYHSAAWIEGVFLKADGAELPVELMKRSVRFQGKSHTLLIGRDMTARQHMAQEKATLEQQLRQVQKMEAVGRLASGVAHDMNNILTAIMAHASLIKAREKETNPSWAAGDVIEKAVRRGKELTTQLLGFARQGKHHHVPVDIHSVIQEVIGLLGRTVSKTLTFQTNFLAEQPWVVGDPNQLYQVLMNLAVNACDAMKHSGQLLFQTSNECVTEDQASQVPGLNPGESVVIRVTDTGEGIPPDVQSHVFEPFFTTKDQGQGSGMGLAMVYGIVKNHRGYIGLTSTLGVGTTMRVYLPSAPHAEIPGKIESVQLPAGGTGHILVVDDEPDVGEAAKAILEYLGYEVTLCVSGEEALSQCRESNVQVDVVLLDMVMPNMSGSECFTQLRALHPETKIILCTGYDRNHAVQELLDQGVSAFIQKPYNIDELARVCAEAVKPTPEPEVCIVGD